jgi:chromate transporter
VIDALFFGLKSAVLVFVVEAVLRIGRRALKGKIAWSLAVAAFVALFFFHVPFPAVVLISAAIGYFWPDYFSHGGHGEAKQDRPAVIDAMLAADPERPVRMAASARNAALLVLVVWLLPVAYLMAAVGGTFADVAWFFSKMAVVTIGGAYAVLAYVAQDAVEAYHWLSPAEMLAGLGLAETTPGPLILVLQFVGFLAGFRAPGPLTGTSGGIVSSLLTLWVTFAPCFVFVFLGAPVVERLRSHTALTGALAAVTASVVGVISNLAVWFALHVLFRDHGAFRLGPVAFDLPIPSSINLAALALAAIAAACLFRLKLGVLRTLGITAALGLAARFVMTL